MRKKGIILLICAITFFSGCQTVEDDIYDLTPDNEPEEYADEEFSEGMRQFRRAEILMIGSIPFTILFTNIGYSLYNALSDGVGEGFSIENFTSSTNMTTEERYKILAVSLSLSGAIAYADRLIESYENGELLITAKGADYNFDFPVFTENND